jgi:hypothetical protein
LFDGLVRAENESHGTDHKHDGAPSGGLGKKRSGTARAEGGLATRATEGAGQVGGFAALEQDDGDEHEAVQNEKGSKQPSGKAEAENDNSEADQQSDGPFHPTWHGENPRFMRKMSGLKTDEYIPDIPCLLRAG